MNLTGMLYMGVLMNQYRNEIMVKNPPDTAIKIFSAAGNFAAIRPLIVAFTPFLFTK